MGGSMTACLNAANERANELFRAEKLSFLGIPKIVEVSRYRSVMQRISVLHLFEHALFVCCVM
jgi:1-deoxy-D-xylulose 5-phosphate reductoisomerase